MFNKAEFQAEWVKFAKAKGLGKVCFISAADLEKGVGIGAVGFAVAALGPFKCGHCRFMKAAKCTQAEVLETVELRDKLDKDGLLPVEAGDCCNEYEPAKTPGKSGKEGNVDEQKLKKVFPFQIVDKADGTHLVVGIATSETVDHDGECAEYAGTLDAIKTWSAEFAKTTSASGQQLSLGNIRVQHDAKQIGGKVTAINPDDKKKTISIDTQPLDSVYDELIEPGMVTGFSIAGRYAKKWEADGIKYYIPEITEISYVDHPCNPDAGFTHVKANGQVEFCKFADLRKAAESKAHDSKDEIGKRVRAVLIEAGLLKEAKTKRVAGEDLPASCFAYVGDKDDPATWKLPYKGFSTEAKNKSHVRNALARFNQTQGIPAGEKAKVKAKLVAAAKKHGIEVSDKSAKAVRAALIRVLCEQTDEAGKARYDRAAAEAMLATADEIFAKVAPETALFKGMYTVGNLAGVMDSLSWILASTEYERDYEQDDSTVPDDLRSVLEDLIPVFIAMATEEATELLNQTKKTADGGQGGRIMSEQNADLLKAAKDAAIELWKKAKSLFGKIAKGHEGCSKAFMKAADHHDSMAEHHAEAAETYADKAVQDELAKLADGADFKKGSKLDQVLAKAEILIEKGSGHAKLFGKMAKAHGNIAKCMTKAAGHHDDLGKAAVDAGSAEDAPDTQNRSKEEEEAKAAAAKAAAEKLAAEALAKGGNPELVKLIQDGFASVTNKLAEQDGKIAAIQTEVKKQGDVLDLGPVEAAKRRAALAVDPKLHSVNATGKSDSENGNSLDPSSIKNGASSSAAGMFGR
jgi:hypothetical protein